MPCKLLQSTKYVMVIILYMVFYEWDAQIRTVLYFNVSISCIFYVACRIYYYMRRDLSADGRSTSIFNLLHTLWRFVAVLCTIVLFDRDTVVSHTKRCINTGLCYSRCLKYNILSCSHTRTHTDLQRENITQMKQFNYAAIRNCYFHYNITNKCCVA